MTGKEIIKITFTLVAIYLAGALLLAAVYAKTSPVIYRKNMEEKQAALQKMMPRADDIVKLGDWEPHEKHAEYYSGFEDTPDVVKGGAYFVVWKSRNIKECVRIELLRDGKAVKALAECAPNDGRFPLDAAALADGSGYKVRVAAKDGSVSAESPAFAVSARPLETAAPEKEAEGPAKEAAQEAPDARVISNVIVGKKIGYIVETYGKGYSSYIDILFSVDDQFKVEKISILHHAETPGLGDEIQAPWFKKQFAGKDEAHLVVKKGETKDYIQAITGATISSRAVTEDGVRKGLEFLKEALDKGKGGEGHGPSAGKD
jgi:RnfABCDGE-type electron transport complex G subunit